MISFSEQILYILNGLGDEYDAVVAISWSMDPTSSISYIHSILLVNDGRIDHKKATIADLSVNYVATNKEKFKKGQTTLREVINSTEAIEEGVEDIITTADKHARSLKILAIQQGMCANLTNVHQVSRNHRDTHKKWS